MASVINQLRVDLASQYASSTTSQQPLFLFFGSMTRWSKKFAILDVTAGVTTSIELTPGHGVVVGQSIRFHEIEGMTQLNGIETVVTGVNGQVITVNVSSVSFSTYVSGGYVSVLEDVVEPRSQIDDLKTRILGMKIVTGDMMCHVVKRNDWGDGKIFVAYDTNIDLIEKEFHCVSNGSIYICLDNAAGAVSTVRPVGTSRKPQRYNDGYIWKFIQRIDARDMEKFGSEEWVPVRPMKYVNSNRGSIQSIRIIDRGQNYNHNDIVKIIGDGVNARFSIGRFLANGSIMNMIPIDHGSNYTWAEAWIEPGPGSLGTGAVLEVSINKLDDVVDPVQEMFATTIRFSVDVFGDEDGAAYLGPIRTSGLLRISPDAFKSVRNSFVDTRSSFDLDANGQVFAVGDEIVGLISGTRAFCAGSSETKLYFVEENGNGFVSGEIVSSGVKSAVVKNVNRFDTSILSNSTFLKVDNFAPKNRNKDQIDRFVFSISF